MTLQEALSEVNIQDYKVYRGFSILDVIHIANGDHDDDAYMREAIATILNAVVKGELKHE